jgi:hypothetical protein
MEKLPIITTFGKFTQNANFLRIQPVLCGARSLAVFYCFFPAASRKRPEVVAMSSVLFTVLTLAALVCAFGFLARLIGGAPLPEKEEDQEWWQSIK